MRTQTNSESLVHINVRRKPKPTVKNYQRLGYILYEATTSSRVTFSYELTGIGKADYIQPAMVKLGITAMAKVAAEVEQAGATCVPNAFYLGPAFLAALHCLAVKEKDSPLERMFADFGATPFAKTVPVINGGVEVPQGPGLGADPEDDLIAQFRV